MRLVALTATTCPPRTCFTLENIVTQALLLSFIHRLRVVLLWSPRAPGVSAGSSRRFGSHFTPLLISYIGKGDLKTVTGIEFSSSGFRLTGENLIMGLYVNELMVRLLAKSDPLENLFGAYQSVLKDLMIGEAAQASLRKFELFLLDAMGYGINFNETSNRAQIEPNKRYEFRAGEGFIPVVDVWRDHQFG